MREKRRRLQEALLFLGAAVLFGAMVWLLWAYVPRREVRYGLLGICAGLFLLAALWRAWVRRQVADFADSLCDILDSLTPADVQDFARRLQEDGNVIDVVFRSK